MNHYQLLLSKSKKNNIVCDGCNSNIKEAHLLCIQFYLNKTDNKIYWKSEYTVGCTHEEWDGEPWCNGCVTIADNKILCASCGNLDWGTPKFGGNKLKYIWIDGSESCFDELY